MGLLLLVCWLLGVVCGADSAKDAPEPWLNFTCHVCAKEKAVTVCRFRLTTNGHHIKAFGGELFLEGGARLLQGDEPFHKEGEDVQSSCLTFMHGDSQAVDRSLSSLRLAGNKISLSWFFFDKHDENAKDQLVLQIAFQGGGALTGDLFSYTTSQLTYGHRKVFCKSLAEPSSPKSLAQERQLRAQELVRAKNEEAAKKKVEEVKKVPFTPISQQGKATIEKKATLSPREVIADANRALLEGIKRKRLEKEEKKQLEQESQESSKPAAEQKKRKRRKSMEEDDDGKEEVVVQMPPASVWHSVWFKVLAVFLLATGGLGCLYMFCSGSSVSNHKKRY